MPPYVTLSNSFLGRASLRLLYASLPSLPSSHRHMLLTERLFEPCGKADGECLRLVSQLNGVAESQYSTLFRVRIDLGSHLAIIQITSVNSSAPSRMSEYVLTQESLSTLHSSAGRCISRRSGHIFAVYSPMNTLCSLPVREYSVKRMIAAELTHVSN